MDFKKAPTLRHLNLGKTKVSRKNSKDASSSKRKPSTRIVDIRTAEKISLFA